MMKTKPRRWSLSMQPPLDNAEEVWQEQHEITIWAQERALCSICGLSSDVGIIEQQLLALNSTFKAKKADDFNEETDKGVFKIEVFKGPSIALIKQIVDTQ
ncbi:hypothetical protein L3H50_08715 [Corynebacterium sp. MC-04]|uniref:Uncharacterized protein n=2 Tax=Corynebacterium parakroppenstedtii TaxID=2828363 RepID=A0ABS9HNI9_9CORY|nr:MULTISPECIES: hypothetical protein [Corynebacterium]KXB50053.1 hypothetical protein HMPREF1861_01525 [Corynebacterium kroppenstedtii]MBY0793525.1 hypothetical protein [Corynebacterium parakroppenstedtii]MCF6770369.1 hypothetical protein [Corynebacterium parakroppenstedtii]MCF6772488.1 hypothetical protein [Corynebacterium parakroppenstedtii]MCF6774596.1 hypothetical protein [Corynebacterium parakroppenstedtii]